LWLWVVEFVEGLLDECDVVLCDMGFFDVLVDYVESLLVFVIVELLGWLEVDCYLLWLWL